jgi:excisionase family DNA binding protein
MTTPKRGFNYEEAAVYLGSTPRTMKDLVSANTLPAKYLGQRVLIDIADLDALFDGLPTERPKPGSKPGISAT